MMEFRLYIEFRVTQIVKDEKAGPIKIELTEATSTRH